MASETIKAPTMAADVECWGRNDGGELVRVWKAHIPKNVVVDQGKGQLFNRAFGFQTASTFGPYMHLLSATTASNQVWSNVSASRLGSYGANVPQMSFATTYTNGVATGTCSFGFSAGTQTISGAALVWHTTNTLSTGAVAAGVAMYNHGLFAASQQVQAANTVSVSATFSFA